MYKKAVIFHIFCLDLQSDYNAAMTTPKFMINTTTGLLEQAVYLSSPHYDERPPGMPVDMVVIHNISLPPGEFGSDSIERFFCGKLDKTAHPYFEEIADMRVSSHLFIKRSGDIIQFVPFHQRAWHAGESFFDGRTRCNDFSIGIELEGTDDLPYEDVQYQQLAGVISTLLREYPRIARDRIVGHADIAPVRKTDPGPAFNWEYLKGMLA